MKQNSGNAHNRSVSVEALIAIHNHCLHLYSFDQYVQNMTILILSFKKITKSLTVDR